MGPVCYEGLRAPKHENTVWHQPSSPKHENTKTQGVSAGPKHENTKTHGGGQAALSGVGLHAF